MQPYDPVMLDTTYYPGKLIRQEKDSPSIMFKDNVNSPAHYSKNHIGIECIDAMEAMLTPEEFLGYLRGNMFKYSWRFRYKNGEEDVAKLKWYTDKLGTHLTKYPELTKGEKK